VVAYDTAYARYGLLSRLRSAGVSKQVTTAIMRVPRDQFVPSDLKRWAWLDESLPIGEGQTISQPSLVGRMIDQLEPEQADTILDVGTGSGYQAAVLSLLVRRVVSVERITRLRDAAAKQLSALGYRNVEVFLAGEELGWMAESPYDGIIVGAASPEVPKSLVRQLEKGARLVIPVGDRNKQQIIVVRRTRTGTKKRRLDYVRFVPLIGRDAWKS
jgi:protein-L-isoaspartate(D-aspartate) O-methyltransferase